MSCLDAAEIDEQALTAEDRQAQLEAALAEKSLELRGDSQLCSSYIAGTLDETYTPELITEICCLHRWLYESTDYSSRCQAILPQRAMQLAPSLGSYSAAWQYVKVNEASALKTQVLAEFGIPQVWPWLAMKTVGTQSPPSDTAASNSCPGTPSYQKTSEERTESPVHRSLAGDTSC